MPTPVQLLLDPISLTVFALYAALIAWEALFPARALPRVRYWQLRGLAAFVLYFFVSSYLPLAWSAWLQPWQVFDLTALPTWAGALVGVLVYEAGVYAWHRTMHASTVLWRGLHQMHHSAERLDTFGAFWFSPLDMVGWTALSSLCLVVVVGLTPQAATLVLYITTFMGVFQHANIRTPQWLGYLIQRPESHSVHHQRGVHAWNYSDLPLFDLLMGTFRNPPAHAPEQGFWHGASGKVPAMLAFRDVARGNGGAVASGTSDDLVEDAVEATP
jgi:sterol desaturase/sphingolipid hydroxylase (fatty acid hydroxylase superfamily)